MNARSHESFGPRDAVDVHVHWTPGAFLASAGDPTGSALRPAVRFEGGRQAEVRLGGRLFDSVRGELSRLDVVLSEAEHRGTGRVLLSPWVSTLPLAVPAEQAAAHCREYNAAVSDAVSGHGDRVKALAAVPIQSPALASEVLHEAVSRGLVGAEVTPATGNQWLGDDALEPFFAAAESSGAVLFVHPGLSNMTAGPLRDYYLWNAVGNPYDTGLAAAHMVMAGVLERHPRLKVLLAHGGGALPSVAARLGRAFEVRPQARARLESPPAQSMALLYHDTVVHGQEALRCLVALAGAGHVMLGSDHPFDMGTDDPVGDVIALGLSEADTAAVLAGNASQLFWPEPSTIPDQNLQGGT